MKAAIAAITAIIALSLLQLSGCATQIVSHIPAPAPTAIPLPAQPSALQIFVDTALAMRGTPYRFGGSEPGGFDCSGLVEYAGRRAGIALPRTAVAQLRAGVAVTRDALQPGDLVFMRINKELHVGIMTLAGQFVHAPSSGGFVRVDRLDAPPYAKAFREARRINP